MANEIRLAFAHPSERAIATEGEAPRDRISLREHVREVEIGAFQAERGHTQRIRFDIVVEVTPAGGPLDDDVDRILSYDRVTEAIGIRDLFEAFYGVESAFYTPKPAPAAYTRIFGADRVKVQGRLVGLIRQY